MTTTGSIPDQFVPLVWIMTNLICPMIIGLMAGAFVRAWLKAFVLASLVSAAGLLVLVVMGVVHPDLARAAWSWLKDLCSLSIPAFWSTVKACPVLGVAALIGLAAGILMRESWMRHRCATE